jgi:hypothetical protein
VTTYATGARNRSRPFLMTASSGNHQWFTLPELQICRPNRYAAHSLSLRPVVVSIQIFKGFCAKNHYSRRCTMAKNVYHGKERRKVEPLRAHSPLEDMEWWLEGVFRRSLCAGANVHRVDVGGRGRSLAATGRRREGPGRGRGGRHETL